MVSKPLVSRKSKSRPPNRGQKHVPRMTVESRAAAAAEAAAVAAAAQAKKERRRRNNLRRLWDKMVFLKRPAKGAASKKPVGPPAKKPRMEPPASPHMLAIKKERSQTTTCSSTAHDALATRSVGTHATLEHDPQLSRAATSHPTAAASAAFPSSLRPPSPPSAPPLSTTRTLVFDEHQDEQQDEGQNDQVDERLLQPPAPIGGAHSPAALSNVLDSDDEE